MQPDPTTPSFTCQTCGRIISVRFYSIAKVQRYCSQACYHRAQIKQHVEVTKTCQACGMQFVTTDAAQQFCSRQCVGKRPMIGVDHRGRRLITQDEIEYIREHYATQTIKQMCEALNRPKGTVSVIAHRLGLNTKDAWKRRWTAEEDEYLRNNYALVSCAEAAKVLNSTELRTSVRAHQLGIKGLWLAGQQSLNEHCFQTIDSAAKAYALGLLAADGNITDKNSLSLHLLPKDVNAVEFVRDLIGSEIRLHNTSTGLTGFSIIIHEMADDLAHWGIIPRKTHSLIWPTDFPEEWTAEYILGYFDGDGSLGFTKRDHGARMNIVGRREFLEGAIAVIKRGTGLQVPIWQQAKGKPLCSAETSYIKACTLSKWLHRSGLGLPRKNLHDPSNVCMHCSGDRRYSN